MSEKNSENGKSSFWTTLPGCLTGIAAIITAIGGLITILVAVGIMRPPPVTPAPVIPTSTLPSPIVCVPTLISPPANAILDNGRIDGFDQVVWDFDWSDCPEASEYQLYVIGSQVVSPVIDNSTLTVSAYHEIRVSYMGGANLFGWTWKVRAGANGQWGEWSETRVFDVEPPDTDPPPP